MNPTESFSYRPVRLNAKILDPAGEHAARVARICELTGLDRDTFLGKYAQWCSFHISHSMGRLTPENCRDHELQVTRERVDAFIRCPGFAAALIDAGWLDAVGERLILGFKARAAIAEEARRHSENLERKRRKAEAAAATPVLTEAEQAQRKAAKEARKAERKTAWEAGQKGPKPANTSKPAQTLAGIRKANAGK